MPHALVCCRPFVQRYAILLANGRGAYQPLDTDCMEQRELAETVRKLLQAAKLDGWQVHILAPVACLWVIAVCSHLKRYHDDAGEQALKNRLVL